MQSVDISVIRTVGSRIEDEMTICSGEVTVSEQYTSYRVMRYDTVLSVEPLDLPPITFNTRALWFDVPSRLEDRVRAAGEDIAGGMHGVEHAFIAMMPFHVLCDRRDIGGLSTQFHESTGGPAIFVYDGYEGGIGLSEKAFDIFSDISKTAYELVRDCPCETGCPACIYSPKCGSDNQPLDKAAAVHILETLCARGNQK
jgi:DEAD/DEAH box helicase domain-containing protein